MKAALFPSVGSAHLRGLNEIPGVLPTAAALPITTHRHPAHILGHSQYFLSLPRLLSEELPARAAEQVMSRSKWFSTWEIRGSAGRRRVLEPQPQGSKQALPSDFGLVPP